MQGQVKAWSDEQEKTQHPDLQQGGEAQIVLTDTFLPAGETPGGGNGVLPPPPPAAPTTGSLEITSDPPGAKVAISGAMQPGVTPLTVTGLPPGPVTVQVMSPLAAYGDAEQTVTIAAGGTQALPVKLTLLQGSLRVKSTPPGASVYLDDEKMPRGVTTEDGLLLLALPLGTHTVRVEQPHYTATTQQAEVLKDTTTDVQLTLAGLPARLTVTTTPKGAAVYLDGAEVGASLPRVAGGNPRHAPRAREIGRV